MRQQMTDMEDRNTREHAAVIRRFDGLEARLDGKVDQGWMSEQRLPQRVDSLESTRDEGKGKRWMVKVGEGIALFVMALVGLLLGKGLHL